MWKWEKECKKGNKTENEVKKTREEKKNRNNKFTEKKLN